ncbi:hypothetical protein OC834_006930 [Tilletia horrida]|nr:hypothetical protein OC834_006930 [Tilletia horrida]
MLVTEPPRLAHRSYDMAHPTTAFHSSASGHTLLTQPPTSSFGNMHLQSHHHPRPPPQLDAKVVILGSQGVGKTSMVHRYTVESFNPRATPSTIGAQFSTKKIICDGVKVRLQLWDTAGQERYKSMMPLYYRGSHAAVIVYDITSRQSFEDVKGWVEELRKNMADDLVIHIVGSKLDLAENARAVELGEARDMIHSWFAPPPPPEPAPRPSTSTSSLLFFPTSASTNEVASHAVSGLTRAVSTRLAGMRANSFTRNNNGNSNTTGNQANPTGSLTRSKTAHVAVPGRTLSTGGPGTGVGAPMIQPRGASLDALRNVPFPSSSAAASSSSSGANAEHTHLPSSPTHGSVGRQGSLSGRGGQILARMRTNSSMNIFPSLLSSSASAQQPQQPASPGEMSCAKCGSLGSGSGPGSSASGSSYCSIHGSGGVTSTTAPPTTPGSSLDQHGGSLEGPIMVIDGIELSEVSAKDDEGIEYVFNAIARKLVERRLPAGSRTGGSAGIGNGGGLSGDGSSTGVGGSGAGGTGRSAKSSRTGSATLQSDEFGSIDAHGASSSGGSGLLGLGRSARSGRGGSSANARQSIILHQPEPDEDDDDDEIDDGDHAGSHLLLGAADSGFGGRSGFRTPTSGAGAVGRDSRPDSVHLDRRGRETSSAGWSGSCCSV